MNTRSETSNRAQKSLRTEWLDMIKSATQAPSSHNTQPWKFRISEGCITIYPDYSRRLPVVDPHNRELFISLGCALENLVTAARAYGYSPNVCVFPETDPEGLRVQMGPKAGVEDYGNILTMVKRQTNRSEYTKQAIPEPDTARIKALPLETDVSLNVYTAIRDTEKLIRLVKQANEWQINQKAFREELSEWIRFSENTATGRSDGLTANALGIPTIPDWVGKILVKYWLSDSSQSHTDEKRIRSASALLILSSASDDKPAWVNVGRSFERLALQLTSLGIQYAHVNQACEVSHLRSELREYFTIPYPYPQLILRLGYASRLPYSHRRPIEEVLID